jgi:rare lipoprotein A
MSCNARPLPRGHARLPGQVLGAVIVATALGTLGGCQTMATVGRAIAGIEDPPAAPPPTVAPVVASVPAAPTGSAAPASATAAAPAAASAAPGLAVAPPAPASAPAPVAVPAPLVAAPAAAAPAAAATPPDELVPKLEPLHPGANRMYAMHGRTYWPITDDRPFDERGAAAIIEPRRAGAATASGEPYDPAALSAGHPRLPIPSYARVTHRASGRSVLVRINDRGPVRRDRVIALSEAAARRIGLADGDSVDIVRLTNAEILQMEAARRTAAPVVAAVPAAPAAVAIPVPVAAAPSTAPLEVLVPPVPMPPGSGAPARAAAPTAQPAPVPATTAAVAPPPVPVPPVPAPGAGAASPAAPASRPAEGALRAAPVPSQPTAAPAAAAATPAAAAAAAQAPAPRPTPSGRAPRWAVQIGAFAVQDNADTLSERAARQLASGLSDVPASERTPRVERRGNRFVVLVGDFNDLSRAQAHGLKVGGVLRQNVTVVER